MKEKGGGGRRRGKRALDAWHTHARNTTREHRPLPQAYKKRTLPVHQNVPVVAVLDLQDVAHYAVGSQAARKVGPGNAEPVWPAHAPFELLLKPGREGGVVWVIFLEAVQGNGVGDGLNEPRAGVHGKDVVSLEPHGHLGGPENGGKLGQQLGHKLLLPQVVIGLDDAGQQPPAGELAMG